MESLNAGLSIVIVSWNTRDLLRRCLASARAEILSFPAMATEIIVVDNASSDGTGSMVKEEFPEAVVLENKKNVGFAAANNQGIRCAHGNLILLLNPDTEFHPGALGTLLRFMDATPRAGAAGACLTNPDGSLQRSAYPMPTLAREFWRLFHLDRLRPLTSYTLEALDSSIAHPVDVAQGASLMLRRRALEQVGLLDEDYFMYTEEVDLCFRLKRAGWGVYWLPGAKVLHWGGQSTRQLRAEMFIRLYESKVLFFRKHYGPVVVVAYKLVLALAAVPRILLGWMGPRAAEGGGPRSDLSPDYVRLLKALPSL
jgi:GT2 family glycosyltransferase